MVATGLGRGLGLLLDLAQCLVCCVGGVALHNRTSRRLESNL